MWVQWIGVLQKNKSEKYLKKIERMILQKYFLQNMPLFGYLVKINLDIAIEFYVKSNNVHIDSSSPIHPKKDAWKI